MPSAVDFLLQSQNVDGGWGYRVGGMSYVEPTAAVLLALRGAANDSARPRARDFLLALQHPDGGWGIAAIDDESGWMTAWAVRALADPSTGSGQSFPDARAAVDKGALWLLRTGGIVVTEPRAQEKIRDWYGMDSTLRGFPWQVGDASWVHPTALAVLALVAANLREHARTHEGIAYLLDRAIAGGGWNIGNPQMIDKKIPATIQDTAVALLALRAVGVPSDTPQVARALTFLADALRTARTSAELAWGVWAARDWRLEVGEWALDARRWTLDIGRWIERLKSLQRADGSWEGNPCYAAIALLAQNQAASIAHKYHSPITNYELRI